MVLSLCWKEVISSLALVNVTDLVSPRPLPLIEYYCLVGINICCVVPKLLILYWNEVIGSFELMDDIYLFSL